MGSGDGSGGRFEATGDFGGTGAVGLVELGPVDAVAIGSGVGGDIEAATFFLEREFEPVDEGMVGGLGCVGAGVADLDVLGDALKDEGVEGFLMLIGLMDEAGAILGGGGGKEEKYGLGSGSDGIGMDAGFQGGVCGYGGTGRVGEGKADGEEADGHCGGEDEDDQVDPDRDLTKITHADLFTFSRLLTNANKIWN
jgi:hypothetical protein